MSKKILVLGAGKSSSALIQFLAETASVNGWSVMVADQSEQAAKHAIINKPNLSGCAIDITKEDQLNKLISGSNVVLSLLPAHLHPLVAKKCVENNAHLITASYVSDEMRALHQRAEQSGLLLLNECGLDPGIDHISAMEIIDRIRESGGEIHTFRSFTGGLIAPATDPENPWRYKFTWNPRNVVTAGQGFATYREDSKLKRIPYQQLFKRTFAIEVPGTGKFDGYANRDSLKYCDAYGLQQVKTMIRGTLRYHGYCQAWDILVQLGCCEDQGLISTEGLSHLDFLNLFLPASANSVEKKISLLFRLTEDSKEIQMLRWSGFFSDESIGISSGTPAQILEHILNKKWKMNATDLDQIVMWHQFIYIQNGQQHEIQSTLVDEGKPDGPTAMARTVGLPMGIAAKLLLENKINLRGVQIPVSKQLYVPLLKELSNHAIVMKEYQIS